jgi:hypothetical protein
MKYLPIDLSTFSTMITENYVYVDKTEHIYRLFSGGSRLYFFARPRRFGKSLLISTLKELFSGNRELFKGLWIYSSDYQWNTYPVIHLDFANIGHETADDLKKSLSQRLREIAADYNITAGDFPTINDQITSLIKQLAQINKVVILIDEYDKPILDHISDLERAHSLKKTIAGMYDTIKSMDAYIRAIFVTGVTKLARTSIFSGMNNLNDISFDPQSAQLVGYTQDELIHYFGANIDIVAKNEGRSVDEVLADMKLWYNGYRFSKLPIKVYNPFSTMYYLSKQELANYWFQSGTPTFLIHLIKQQYVSLEEIPTAAIRSNHLETFHLEDIPLVPLLFQTGYLTIDDYNPQNRITLKYPNYEVEESFTKLIVLSLTDTTQTTVETTTYQIITSLKKHNFDAFCISLKSLFSRIPYSIRIDRESYYHSLFQFLMNLLILETHSEVLTHDGRVDTVIRTDDCIYIFELKVNKPAQEALAQILHKKYYESYLIYNKPIMLIGLSFKIDEEHLDVSYIAQDIAR